MSASPGPDDDFGVINEQLVEVDRPDFKNAWLTGPNFTGDPIPFAAPLASMRLFAAEDMPTFTEDVPLAKKLPTRPEIAVAMTYSVGDEQRIGRAAFTGWPIRVNISTFAHAED
jgi:hypothetical protein